jgi:hypothetical protein
MAKAAPKKAAGKKKPKGYIDFKRFVQEAFRDEGKPRDDSEEFKIRRKVIVKFYKICAGGNFTRTRIQNFLINKGYGNEGDVLHDDHWGELEKIRYTSNAVFCNGQKY